jgi:predicted RNA-binding Zn ribbon-like protein
MFRRTIVPFDRASAQKLAREELSIKFINTVAWRRRDPVEDRVGSPDALLKWFLDEGSLDRQTFFQTKERWKQAPREANDFLRAGVELREALYSLFLAHIADKNADPRNIDVLNATLAGSIRDLRLTSSRKTLKWAASSAANPPEVLLKAIAWSAAGLLMGPRAKRIKQCEDERGCGWLFIDESRSQNRRWCSMGDCGNLAKSRRHYQRAAHT